MITKKAATKVNPHKFRYTRVNSDFPTEISEHLQDGESVVVLGPRYIGKRHVLAEVEKALRHSGQQHVFVLHLLGQSWTSRRQLQTVVCRGLGGALQDLGWREPCDRNDLVEEFQHFIERTPCHVIALISDVDALPDHLARRLLKSIRRLASASTSSEGRFTVLLTGAVGLAPLVHGVDSDFDCATQYVVQGYAQEMFGSYVHQTARAAGLSVDTACEFHEELFQLCGGNIYLVRLLFWCALENRRAREVETDRKLTLDELRNAAGLIDSPGVTPAELLLHAYSRIGNSPEACQMVADLLEHGSLAVPASARTEPSRLVDNFPTTVELSGLGIRNDGRISFSCPLSENVCRRFFTHWRLGDLFACCQEWEQAFAQYAKAGLPGENRVFSPVSRPELPSAVRAFAAALHERARLGIRALNEFLVDGARELLGFEEITFWTYRGAWTYSPPETGEASNEEIREKCRALLPSVAILRTGVHPLEADVAPYALLVGLPFDDPDLRTALILSNFHEEAPLTRERVSLCMTILDAYLLAFEEASRIVQVERERDVQRHLLDSIPALLECVTGKPVSTLTALQTAADRLRAIAYRRVMIALVDPTRTYIEGLFDRRPTGEPDVAKMTRWELDADTEDVQPYCVATGETVLMADARNHPLANKQVVEAAGMKAVLVVPIRTFAEVVGTLHIERTDRMPPSQDEVRALRFFAEQLGRVMGLTERVSMLEAAIDSVMYPLGVLDRRERFRYINPYGARKLGLKPGWQDGHALPKASDHLIDASISVFREAMKKEKPVSRYVRRPGKKVELLTLFAAPVMDWRSMPIGGMLQSNDLTAFGRMFQTVTKLASCHDVDSLFEGLFEATRQLGHEWARLYLMDGDTGRLVGRLQYGLPDGSDDALAFGRGEVVLSDHQTRMIRDARDSASRKPIVCCHDPRKEDGAIWLTASGLSAVNVIDPLCPDAVKKPPGSLWIDFPLFHVGASEPLGMLALSYPRDFGPETFELLGILAEVTSALLSSVSEHKAWAESLVALERHAKEKAFGATAHHLRARIAALGVLLVSYRRIGGRYQEVAELNDALEELLISLEKELQNIRTRLRPLDPHRERKDLLGFTRRVLKQQLAEQCYCVTPPSGRMMADIDTDLFGEVLEELIENACKSAEAACRKLSIQVCAGCDSAGKLGECWIEFRDNGMGVRQEIRERVFDDLYSEWPGQDRSGGLGLGFARRVLEAHGGSLLLRESKEGACFVLRFKRYMNAVSESPQ